MGKFVYRPGSTKFNGSVGEGAKNPPSTTPVAATPSPTETHRRPTLHATQQGFGLTESGGSVKKSATGWLAFDDQSQYVGTFHTSSEALAAAETSAAQNTAMFAQRTEAIAAELHETWRNAWARDNGGLVNGLYPPRLKDDGTGGQVDIANTTFGDLPPKWQHENREAAQAAQVSVLRELLNDQHNTTEDLIEAVSVRVHASWVERNKQWAPDELTVPFDQLNEEEKEKDRVVARAALRAIDGRP
jgi:hypothetical protein